MDSFTRVPFVGVGSSSPASNVDFSGAGPGMAATTLTDLPPDAFIATQQQPKRKFSIFNAAKNFVKGAVVDTIKGMFSFQGLATMAGASAAIALLGTAAIPFLVGAGLVAGGAKALSGVGEAVNRYKQGDVEGAEQAFGTIGSGVAATGLSIAGARAIGKQFTPVEGTATGVRGDLQHLGNIIRGKATNAEGQTAWQLMQHNVRTNLNEKGALGTIRSYFQTKPNAEKGQVPSSRESAVLVQRIQSGFGTARTQLSQMRKNGVLGETTATSSEAGTNREAAAPLLPPELDPTIAPPQLF